MVKTAKGGNFFLVFFTAFSETTTKLKELLSLAVFEHSYVASAQCEGRQGNRKGRNSFSIK